VKVTDGGQGFAAGGKGERKQSDRQYSFNISAVKPTVLGFSLAFSALVARLNQTCSRISMRFNEPRRMPVELDPTGNHRAQNPTRESYFPET